MRYNIKHSQKERTVIILLKHILRNIRENKFRSVLIVLSLAVTSMVLPEADSEIRSA